MLCGVLFIGTTAFAVTDNENPEPRKTSDANVYGHILDAKSNQHIPYVVISLKGTTYATGADATGHYYMKNLPEGTYTLVAEAIGYKTVEKSNSVFFTSDGRIHFKSAFIKKHCIIHNKIVRSCFTGDVYPFSFCFSYNINTFFC